MAAEAETDQTAAGCCERAGGEEEGTPPCPARSAAVVDAVVAVSVAISRDVGGIALVRPANAALARSSNAACDEGLEGSSISWLSSESQSGEVWRELADDESRLLVPSRPFLSRGEMGKKVCRDGARNFLSPCRKGP